MKSLRIIAMTGLVAFCVMFFGSQANTYGQGKSGKSRGNSSLGKMRSGSVIERGIERMTRNRTSRNRRSNRDWDWNRVGRSGKSNNGVRDHGRGIGRGKGQGKGRGYNKRTTRLLDRF